MLTRSAPVAVNQKPTELSVGNATSRTPSCSGTTKFINPMTNGIDPLVIDAGDARVPQIRQVSLEEDPGENPNDGERDGTRGDHRDRLMKRDGSQGQLTEHRPLRRLMLKMRRLNADPGLAPVR